MLKISISYTNCALAIGTSFVAVVFLAGVGAGFSQFGMDTAATIIGYCVIVLGVCLLAIAISLPFWSLVAFRRQGIVWKVYRFCSIPVLTSSFGSVDSMQVKVHRARNECSSEWGASEWRQIQVEVIADGVRRTFLSTIETTLFAIDLTVARKMISQIIPECDQL